MIASFSRALLQDLNANQSQEEFDQKLHDVIVKIYDASISQNMSKRHYIYNLDIMFFYFYIIT